MDLQLKTSRWQRLRQWPRRACALAICLIVASEATRAQEFLAQASSELGGISLSERQCDNLLRDGSTSGARACWNLTAICKPSETQRIADTETCFEMLSSCESYMNKHFEWRAECRDLLYQCLPESLDKAHNGRRCRALLNRCGAHLERRATVEKRCLKNRDQSSSKPKRSRRLHRFRLQSDLIKIRAWCASVWPEDASQQSQCITKQLKELERLRKLTR